MPTYEYECPDCGVLHEHSCSYSAKPSSLDCGCGGAAEPIISANRNGFVANREYDLRPENRVVNFGKDFGRSVQQQHRAYQEGMKDKRQLNRKLRESGKLGQGMEWIGSMPGEMVDGIGLQEGDPEAVAKDPETFLRKTGLHAEQE